MVSKLIGILAFLLGLPAVLQGGIFLFFILPKLSALYEQASNYTVPVHMYITSIAMIILGNVCIWFGYTQFTANKEKYFKYALSLLVATFISLGLYSALIIPSVLQPIYNLTTELR